MKCLFAKEKTIIHSDVCIEARRARKARGRFALLYSIMLAYLVERTLSELLPVTMEAKVASVLTLLIAVWAGLGRILPLPAAGTILSADFQALTLTQADGTQLKGRWADLVCIRMQEELLIFDGGTEISIKGFRVPWKTLCNLASITSPDGVLSLFREKHEEAMAKMKRRMIAFSLVLTVSVCCCRWLQTILWNPQATSGVRMTALVAFVVIIAIGVGVFWYIALPFSSLREISQEHRST